MADNPGVAGAGENSTGEWTKYPSPPRDEVSAQESFRQSAIDKALEGTAASWLEHIHNHDLNYSQSGTRRQSTLQSAVLPDRVNLSSFHSITASSTLRKRRNSTTRRTSSASSGKIVNISLQSGSTSGMGEEGPSGENIELVEGGEDKSKDDSSTPVAINGNQTFRWEQHYTRHVQLLVSLALFSYLGEICRFYIELGFGKACHAVNSEWKICSSDPGTTNSTGGAFFTDLPTNVIGCFLMGLLVSGDGESIAVNLPMAAVPRRSFFQNWVVTHVGIRTGFCGALTTFASWNTQMVIMVCGGRGTQLGYSQWTSAIWGYVIGLYASLQSYQFGVAVAFCLSRWHHPELAKEADKIVDKQAIGVLINRDLPDFERRFLHSILIHEQNEGEEVRDDDHDVLIISTNGESQQQPKEKPKDNKRMKQYGEDNGYHSFYDDHIHHLEAWKVSTENHRNGRGADDEDSYIQELHEIEKNLVVDKIEPRQELLDIARDAGWNIGALRNWTSELDREEAKRIVGYNDDDAPSDEGSDIQKEIETVYFASSYSSLAEVVFNLGLFFITTALLIWSLVYFKKRRNSLLWRSNCLSALLAPFGTYSRWYLSRLNGSVQHPYLEWLPIGTFLANMIASVVSALMAAVLLDIDTDTNPMGATFAKAIQVGYAGSLSTVSTFATETTGLLRALPRAFWGYYYSFGSLICAFVLGFISYSWSVL